MLASRIQTTPKLLTWHIAYDTTAVGLTSEKHLGKASQFQMAVIKNKFELPHWRIQLCDAVLKVNSSPDSMS